MSRPELTYRPCIVEDDFRQCVRLQKSIWNFADVDVLPVRLFVVARKIGGQNFGAFEPRGAMAGFVLALPAIRGGKAYFHSHMLGVLPEYRDRRVGRTLKLMQREDALERGIRLIEWTFDPLELKNAFFNLERLGVIVRRYVPNQYGTSSSALQGGLPTDRLVAEWWIDTPRVRTVLAGEARRAQPAMRLEVPADIAEIKKVDRDRARKAQRDLEQGFEKAFAAGLMVTGFDRKGAYLFGPADVPAS